MVGWVEVPTWKTWPGLAWQVAGVLQTGCAWEGIRGLGLDWPSQMGGSSCFHRAVGGQGETEELHSDASVCLKLKGGWGIPFMAGA